MASEQKTGTAVELTESSRESGYVHHGAMEFENVNNDIPAKYRGTAADKRDMSILGHKQVLRVIK